MVKCWFCFYIEFTLFLYSYCKATEDELLIVSLDSDDSISVVDHDHSGHSPDSKKSNLACIILSSDDEFVAAANNTTAPLK